MMRRLLLAAIVLVAGLGLISTTPALAYDPFATCTDADCTVVKEDKLKADNTNIVWTIMQVVLGALGAISVLMIVIGGLRFVLSQGDASAVSSAKKTVLYAVIGLVVALMAGGIVLLVTEYFG